MNLIEYHHIVSDDGHNMYSAWVTESHMFWKDTHMNEGRYKFVQICYIKWSKFSRFSFYFVDG